MLLMAAVFAFGVAQWLQHAISRPITELVEAARAVGRDERYDVPGISASPDEVGELVHAFDEMVARVRDANAELRRSNEALLHEIAQRERVQVEREQLLVREREASRLKDEFLAAVSHELRTPLNAILGWAQILASSRPSEQTLTKAVASLARNADAQKRVIEDLIDVSRIATGKLRLDFATVDLREVCDAALDAIRPVAGAKHVHIDAAAMPNSPCLVHGDGNRLQQVIWNLLSNAVKFTPAHGAVHVTITARGGTYSLAVSDTGIGIPPEFLPHVFERFRQADGSTTREHGGLGLGLAIVKELTDFHGGSVTAASRGLGHGARFTVTLPQLVASNTATARDTHRVTRARADLTGLRIMAVDDSPDTLDVIASALRASGAEIRIARSGDEALDAWARERCDVLLCDIAMPYMDGFAVLAGIRELDATSHIVTPAIAISAYASHDSRAACLQAGFQQHLAKPFDVGELTRVIASLAAPRLT